VPSIAIWKRVNLRQAVKPHGNLVGCIGVMFDPEAGIIDYK
jgi:hypothetical protein